MLDQPKDTYQCLETLGNLESMCAITNFSLSTNNPASTKWSNVGNRFLTRGDTNDKTFVKQ